MQLEENTFIARIVEEAKGRFVHRRTGSVRVTRANGEKTGGEDDKEAVGRVRGVRSTRCSSADSEEI